MLLQQVIECKGAIPTMKPEFLLGDAALDRINELPREIREDCFAKMNEVTKINAPLFSFLPAQCSDEAYSFDVIVFNALADFDDDLVIIRHSFPPTECGETMMAISQIEIVAEIKAAMETGETPNPYAN
jgi:hypothetical protein